MPHPEIIIFFFVIALIYASVGFGGGSSYIAILALYNLPFAELRFTALVCNIIVVTGGTIFFIREKQVDWKKAIPILLFSVPMAYIGAKLKLSEQVFFIILGCSLLIAGLLLWIKTEAKDIDTGYTQSNPIKNSLLGGAIGLLSGMVGIGGGIFLAPILNLSRWDTSRKIAAVASLFILVNSVSGLAGQLSNLKNDINYKHVLFLCLAVFAGGQIGSRLAAKKFNLLLIRRITGILVLIAGIEILSKHLSF